jgi:2-polyprenyl-3-methyl-5-hydroxy-6-metoxy-1,4-benzoquinol methylase
MARTVDPQGRELELIGRIADPAGRDVLDIGCGDGRTSRRLARRAAAVLGVDPDRAAIAQARAGWNRDGCRFLAADILELALPPASFDLVVFSRSL